MEQLPSTHYIPSFFEVTPSGREYIKSEFGKIYPDIFVNYVENGINAFAIDTNDQVAINALISLFSSQIKLFQNGRNGETPESPRMMPIKHTILEQAQEDSVASDTQLTKLNLNALIDLDEDSEDSSEDTSSTGDLSTHWIPSVRAISILPRGLANAIANVTGCILCPEPEHKRVRLLSGNTQAALAKLQRLEPLLLKLARHGSAPVPCVDYNILSLSDEQVGTGVRYVPIIRRPHAERIVVETKLEERVERMLIGEEQIWNVATSKYNKAENLEVIYTKEDPAVASNIWADYHMQSFGNPNSTRPNVRSDEASVASSTSTPRPNENMGTLEQARVREWSKNVDTRADPTQAVSLPLITEVGADEPASVRVVAQDSDDEAAPIEDITRRVVAEDSDDEVITPVRTRVRNTPLRTIPDAQHQRRDGHATAVNRADRANRRRDDIPASFGTSALRNTAKYVSADAFFAGVPRDGDEHGEARFRTTSPSDQERIGPDVEQGQQMDVSSGSNREFGYGRTTASPPRGQYRSPQQITKQQQPVNSPSMPWGAASKPSESTSEYRSGSAFDPNQCGASPQAAQRGSGRRYLTHQQGFTSTQSQQLPVSTWPEAPVQASGNAQNRRRGVMPAQSRRLEGQLIDYSEDEQQQPVTMMPPPGLSPRRDMDEGYVAQTTHLLDSPLEQIERPPLKPTWDDTPALRNDEFSVSISNSSGDRPLPPPYNLQTKINRRDVSYIRNDALSQLMAAQQKKKEQKGGSMMTPATSERIEPVDEASTRKFYDTMNLRAPNAGKAKKGKSGASISSVGETAAQKAERIAKTKAELGLTSAPPRKLQPQKQDSAQDQISKRAQKAAKTNSTMGHMHADSLKEASRKRISQDFFEQMKDPLEVARLFPGQLEFEIQIGQLLVMPMSGIKPNSAYEAEKWKKMFNEGAITAEVFFTNLLTTSGSEVDGILEAKTSGTKTWSKDTPGPRSVVLDFECQDSSGSEFTLHLNVDGSHSISKDSFLIHQIGIHCPGRTWDACVILKGVPMWHDFSETLQQSVADLIASVYMCEGQQVDIFFRTPSDNSITVREVTVRRTSRHGSQLTGEADVVLKIVECKTLYMTGHRKDRRLVRCSEKDHPTMALEGRVHFEISIMDTAVNVELEKNVSLEVGEMTSEESPDSMFFSYERAACMAGAALRLVDKIDWVGGYNLGTIVQRQFMRARKEEEAAISMPPTMLDHSFLRPVHLSAGMSTAGPRSVAGTRTVIGSTAGGPQMAVHGIRAGTQAQVMTDAMGNLFRIGLGGARIPMNIPEEASTAGDAVAPDDSASQVGQSRRKLQRKGERPDGFW